MLLFSRPNDSIVVNIAHRIRRRILYCGQHRMLIIKIMIYRNSRVLQRCEKSVLCYYYYNLKSYIIQLNSLLKIEVETRSICSTVIPPIKFQIPWVHSSLLGIDCLEHLINRSNESCGNGAAKWDRQPGIIRDMKGRIIHFILMFSFIFNLLDYFIPVYI